MPEVWIPYTVTGSWFRGVMIRTSQNPLTMINAVRQQIWTTDPAVASTINRTFEDFIDDISYSRPRFTLVILSIFAGLGLVLAAIGVYGVLIRVGKWIKHRIIDDAEHESRCSDAQRQGQYGKHREARIFGKSSYRKSDIPLERHESQS